MKDQKRTWCSFTFISLYRIEIHLCQFHGVFRDGAQAIADLEEISKILLISAGCFDDSIRVRENLQCM
jgi:hypothetical protein